MSYFITILLIMRFFYYYYFSGQLLEYVRMKLKQGGPVHSSGTCSKADKCDILQKQRAGVVRASNVGRRIFFNRSTFYGGASSFVDRQLPSPTLKGSLLLNAAAPPRPGTLRTAPATSWQLWPPQPWSPDQNQVHVGCTRVFVVVQFCSLRASGELIPHRSTTCSLESSKSKWMPWSMLLP